MPLTRDAADSRILPQVEHTVAPPAESLGKVATLVEGTATAAARHAISRIPRLAAEVAGRVDPHRANTLLLDLAGHALGFEQRLLAEETDVAATVADQHQ